VSRRILMLTFSACSAVAAQGTSQCRAIPDTTGTGKLRAFRIPAVSMTPTIAQGNLVLVDTSSRIRSTNVQRGDIVVFRSPEERQLIVISRVVGRAGDTLSMRRGRTSINHQQLAEPYAVQDSPGKSENPFFRKKMRQWQERFRPYPTHGEYEADLQDWGPLVVPENALFMLGDNRDSSYDSRYYGFVPDTAVLGYATVVIDTVRRCIRWSKTNSGNRS
jgi:signal peptidase I